MRPQRDGRDRHVAGFTGDAAPVLVTYLCWWVVTPTMAAAAVTLWLIGHHVLAGVVAAVYGSVMATGAWITTPRATTRSHPTPPRPAVAAVPSTDTQADAPVPVLVTVVPDPPALPASPATLTDTIHAAHHRYTHGRDPS